MRIYEIASRHDVKFSELMTGLKATFATPELRIASSDNDKFAVVERVSQRLRRDVRLTKEKFTLIDGVRIDFADGWGLIRASNTEPVLSLRFEALSEERLNEIRSIFETALEQEQNEN
jgi:phosphomannomutase/phosphoglucomutase